jgi:hypothetical protein
VPEDLHVSSQGVDIDRLEAPYAVSLRLRIDQNVRLLLHVDLPVYGLRSARGPAQVVEEKPVVEPGLELDDL